jgi:phage FluMu protein Com
MKPVRCRTCGKLLKKKKDFSIVFEHCYKTFESQPCEIVFHVLCRDCSTEVRTIRKEGKEAEELYKKLSRSFGG